MIGIFGGTFDPVHFGHIKPALDVMQRLSLEELRFIPCSIPALRNLPTASSEQRLLMLHAALDGHDYCFIDERELKRKGTSYMVDTLKSLRDEFKDKSLCLIVGMDAFYGLHKWHQWRSIFELANCVVTYRPGSELNFKTMPEELLEMVNSGKVDSEQTFMQKKHGAILFMPVTQLDISSTEIRERIRQKQPIDELVPEPVNNIIQQQKIYAG